MRQVSQWVRSRPRMGVAFVLGATALTAIAIEAACTPRPAAVVLADAPVVAQRPAAPAAWSGEVASAVSAMKAEERAAEQRLEAERRAKAEQRATESVRSVVQTLTTRATATGGALRDAGARALESTNRTAREALAGAATVEAARRAEQLAELKQRLEAERRAKAEQRATESVRSVVQTLTTRATATGGALRDAGARALESTNRTAREALAGAATVEAARRAETQQMSADVVAASMLVASSTIETVTTQDSGLLPAPAKTETKDWQTALSTIWKDDANKQKIGKTEIEATGFKFDEQIGKLKYTQTGTKLEWTVSKLDKVDERKLQELLVRLVREAVEKSKLWSDAPEREAVLKGFVVKFEATSVTQPKPPVTPATPPATPAPATPCLPCVPVQTVVCCQPTVCKPVCEPRRPTRECFCLRRCK